MLANWDSGYLLAVGRPYQQVPDFLGAAAELGLHADYQVESFSPWMTWVTAWPPTAA